MHRVSVDPVGKRVRIIGTSVSDDLVDVDAITPDAPKSFDSPHIPFDFVQKLSIAVFVESRS